MKYIYGFWGQNVIFFNVEANGTYNNHGVSEGWMISLFVPVLQNKLKRLFRGPRAKF
jgi:hypothetical protein